MTDRPGGRIPAIRTSVHQRSLSRSSNASGSVPNSPKTHEFIHLDEELASKQAESPLVNSAVADTDLTTSKNGVVEPVEVAQIAEDSIVRGIEYLLVALLIFSLGLSRSFAEDRRRIATCSRA